MIRGRGSRRTSHSQRNVAPSRGQLRREGKEQWGGKTQTSVKNVEVGEQRCDPMLTEIVPRGTCLTMCPVQELRNRETQNRLHRFEMMPGTERDRRPKADPLRAVKEYARPAAGKDATNPKELRPPEVLMKTVHFLINDIAASPDMHQWTEIYTFVFDRLRSVRQDMIIQRVSGSDGIAILEPMVRFLVYCSFRLCGEPLRLYDPRINDTHLQECLSWLFDCYATTTNPSPNQEEFQALGLLYNLGSPRAKQHIMELPKEIRTSPCVVLALSINQAFLERNPVRLLRLASRLTFLHACAVHRHLATSRRDLLLIYSHGHSSRICRFPLDKLAQILHLDLSLAAQLCHVYGVEVDVDDKVRFSKSSFSESKQDPLDCKLFHFTFSDKHSSKLKKLLMSGHDLSHESND